MFCDTEESNVRSKPRRVVLFLSLSLSLSCFLSFLLSFFLSFFLPFSLFLSLAARVNVSNTHICIIICICTHSSRALPNVSASSDRNVRYNRDVCMYMGHV